MIKYENGYPTMAYLHKLCDILGVNRAALIPSAQYAEENGVIYYKSEISNRSINTFSKFLIYNQIDIESWDDKRIKINQNKMHL